MSQNVTMFQPKAHQTAEAVAAVLNTAKARQSAIVELYDATANEAPSAAKARAVDRLERLETLFSTLSGESPAVIEATFTTAKDDPAKATIREALRVFQAWKHPEFSDAREGLYVAAKDAKRKGDLWRGLVTSCRDILRQYDVAETIAAVESLARLEAEAAKGEKLTDDEAQAAIEAPDVVAKVDAIRAKVDGRGAKPKTALELAFSFISRMTEAPANGKARMTWEQLGAFSKALPVAMRHVSAEKAKAKADADSVRGEAAGRTAEASAAIVEKAEARKAAAAA